MLGARGQPAARHGDLIQPRGGGRREEKEEGGWQPEGRLMAAAGPVTSPQRLLPGNAAASGPAPASTVHTCRTQPLSFLDRFSLSFFPWVFFLLLLLF